ncbi:hypothetical protein X975_02941, partial [Stegodyphus mimosarum]
MERMEWPAQFPDLNPIENLWDYFGRQVAISSPTPKSLDELEQEKFETTSKVVGTSEYWEFDLGSIQGQAEESNVLSTTELSHYRNSTIQKAKNKLTAIFPATE